MIFTPLSQTVTLSQTPSPLERDILYGRPPNVNRHNKSSQVHNLTTSQLHQNPSFEIFDLFQIFNTIGKMLERLALAHFFPHNFHIASFCPL